MASQAQVTSRRASVRVLPVAVGGCGACAQSVRALLASRYAAQLNANGISFTDSPRHADVVLVTGALTQRERDAALSYIESVPHPRVFVAAGNCAIDGCVFSGSPALVGSTAEALNVHVEIGGCPPEPDALLAAIAQAAQLLADVDAGTDEADEAATSDDADEADDTSDTDDTGDDNEGHDA